MKTIARSAILLVSILILASCRDEIPLDTFDYENYLVVEATLTNELKQQEIKLSRTTQLDTSFANLENNAEVYVMVNDNIRYDFEQAEDGFYRSNEAFSTKNGDNYQLNINTEAGRSYISALVSPNDLPDITNFYAERVINANGVEGIQVYMDVQGSSGSTFFNFKYEETYKIISPFPSPVDFEITNYFDHPIDGISYEVETRANPRQETVCYSTVKSSGVNLGSSGSLDENKLLRHPILFIPADSPKIGVRYSILGQVYAPGQSSYTFYKNLKELSGNDDLLSQKQPGFIVGNISSLTNAKEQVLGFFDVAFQTERRIYFNFEDFEFLEPPYFYLCELDYYDYNDNITSDLTPNQRQLLYSFLQTGNYRIYSRSLPPSDNNFAIITDYCSDCTLYSSNVKPAFWED